MTASKKSLNLGLDKYVWRELHKGGDESMKKATWYINKATEASALRAGELGE